MERQAVSSSNVAAVGYDAETETLEVEFNSGAVYQYSGVPEEIYTGLIGAGSVGKFFNANVKNSYQFQQV